MPPPLWHPLIAIIPYYLYAIAGKSSFGNAEASPCLPAPNGEQGWRKGGDHHLKRGFLQGRLLFIFFRFSRTGFLFFAL